MSGVAGFFHLDGRQADKVALGRMLGTLRHRGSESGIWLEGSIGLGNRTLFVTPEARTEHMPVVDPSGNIVVTADVRIDNRDELRAALGYPPAETGDARLILLAYQRWGEECPARLVGDYAFAIWDGYNKQLFCARDHIGVKPFYYFHSQTVFAFASEIKALLALEAVSHEVNEIRIAELLARHFEDKASTLYRNISRLPPAQTLAVSKSRCSLRKYWQLDSRRELRFNSNAAYAEAFRELFTESVRCRTRAEGPIGAALSGGLDSSSIVCVARRCIDSSSKGPLHTFSALFSGLPRSERRRSDEEHYIRSVLEHVGYTGDQVTAAHFLRADGVSPLRDREKVLWHEDDAFLAPNLYLHWSLYEAANREGVRVFLDGIDGDTTVSHGLEYLPDLVRTLRWGRLLKEAARFCNQPEVGLTPLKVALRFGVKPLIPDFGMRLWDRVRNQGKPPYDPSTAVNPALACRIKLDKRIRKSRATGLVRFRDAREKHRISLESGLIPLGLEVLDKAAAAFGLEPRYPFFDRRLMEFCLALPPEQKLADGWTRSIQRRAMAGILPEAVCWRFSKADLSPAFQRRLLDYETETLERYLFNPGTPLAPYVNLGALRVAYREYRAAPATATEQALAVYAGVMLAFWLDKLTHLTPIAIRD